MSNNDDLLTMNRAQLREEVIKLRVGKPPIDKLQNAWGIIANVSGGDWTKQTTEWQEAAKKWRDDVFGVPGIKSVESKVEQINQSTSYKTEKLSDLKSTFGQED